MGLIAILWTISALLFLAPVGSSIQKPKILLSPLHMACSSRIRNVQKLGSILVDEGYEVHMLMPDICSHIKNNPKIEYLVYETSDEVKTMMNQEKNWGTKIMAGQMADFFFMVKNIGQLFCESLTDDIALMKRMKKENYSLALVDQTDICDIVLVQYLKVPSVLYSNHGWFEPMGPVIPTQLSYASVTLTALSDKMSFTERVENFVTYFTSYIVMQFFLHPVAHTIQDKLKLPKVHINDIISNQTTLFFVNYDFSFDFPRPVMPNFIMIGGIFSEEPKPLKDEVAEFIKDADHGVIVVSFGSNKFIISDSVLEGYLKAFAQRKERVIWKYAYDLPIVPAKNIMVMPWIPQNDLVGHPKTKAFITHCGVSAMHEALYHGIPVIAVPGFADQFHNAAILVDRNHMGKTLGFWKVNEENLASALNDVIGDPKYKANARRVSQRYRSREVAPRERFLYWVDHIVKYGEPQHLVPSAANELNFFQFYSLDVVAFLMFVFTSTLGVFFKCLQCQYRWLLS